MNSIHKIIFSVDRFLFKHRITINPVIDSSIINPIYFSIFFLGLVSIFTLQKMVKFLPFLNNFIYYIALILSIMFLVAVFQHLILFILGFFTNRHLWQNTDKFTFFHCFFNFNQKIKKSQQCVEHYGKTSSPLNEFAKTFVDLKYNTLATQKQTQIIEKAKQIFNFIIQEKLYYHTDWTEINHYLIREELGGGCKIKSPLFYFWLLDLKDTIEPLEYKKIQNALTQFNYNNNGYLNLEPTVWNYFYEQKINTYQYKENNINLFKLALRHFNRYSHSTEKRKIRQEYLLAIIDNPSFNFDIHTTDQKGNNYFHYLKLDANNEIFLDRFVIEKLFSFITIKNRYLLDSFNEQGESFSQSTCLEIIQLIEKLDVRLEKERMEELVQNVHLTHVKKQKI